MGRLLLLVIFATLVAVACIPRPEKQIDYLELPEAIVVQAKTDPGPNLNLPLEKACLVPDFTLYGDGTALFVRDGTVRQARLSEEDVRSLIEPLVDHGYMDYNYDQPRRNIETLSGITFLYVHTQDAANAVALIEVYQGTPDGDEGKQFRYILEFLDALDSLAAREPSTNFTPERQLLAAAAWEGEVPNNLLPPVLPWDGAVDLGSLVPPGSDDVKTIEIEPGSPEPERFVSQGGRTFLICARPVLPYEENFPEFDAPTS